VNRIIVTGSRDWDDAKAEVQYDDDDDVFIVRPDDDSLKARRYRVNLTVEEKS
jgi:hypothetical protein